MSAALSKTSLPNDRRGPEQAGNFPCLIKPGLIQMNGTGSVLLRGDCLVHSCCCCYSQTLQRFFIVTKDSLGKIPPKKRRIQAFSSSIAFLRPHCHVWLHPSDLWGYLTALREQRWLLVGGFVCSFGREGVLLLTN